MNIFVLDRNPEKAARMQCDKHVVKMILETAQMLSTAVVLTGGTPKNAYRPTHKNHPCTKWARETKQNFRWLKNHGLALCDEYTKRYGKVHKSEKIIRDLSEVSIPEGPLTDFALAMPVEIKEDIKNKKDPVLCYRDYYRKEKREIAKWNYSEKPDWF